MKKMQRFVRSNVPVVKGNCVACINMDGKMMGVLDTFPAGTEFYVYALNCNDVLLCTEGELYCSVSAQIFMKFFIYIEG